MGSIGPSRVARRQATGLVFAGFVALCLGLPLSGWGRAQRSKSAQAIYAVVAGTVFQDDGRLLPGAEVILTPSPEDGSPPGRKPLKGVSDARGEFAFRVPAMPMRYTVIVKARGFRAQEKQVSISGEVRADVFFQMERAPSED
jgi:hypothetical protein